MSTQQDVCNNCGQPTTADGQFCRSCGSAKQVVAGQLVKSTAASAAPRATVATNRIRRFAIPLLAILVLLAVGGGVWLRWNQANANQNTNLSRHSFDQLATGSSLAGFQADLSARTAEYGDVSGDCGSYNELEQTVLSPSYYGAKQATYSPTGLSYDINLWLATDASSLREMMSNPLLKSCWVSSGGAFSAPTTSADGTSWWLASDSRTGLKLLEVTFGNVVLVIDASTGDLPNGADVAKELREDILGVAR